MITRRGFIAGLIAAPAILKLGLYMPVRSSPVVLQDPLQDLFLNTVPIPYNDAGFSMLKRFMITNIGDFLPVWIACSGGKFFELCTAGDLATGKDYQIVIEQEGAKLV